MLVLKNINFDYIFDHLQMSKLRDNISPRLSWARASFQLPTYFSCQNQNLKSEFLFQTRTLLHLPCSLKNHTTEKANLNISKYFAKFFLPWWTQLAIKAATSRLFVQGLMVTDDASSALSHGSLLFAGRDLVEHWLVSFVSRH